MVVKSKIQNSSSKSGKSKSSVKKKVNVSKKVVKVKAPVKKKVVAKKTVKKLVSAKLVVAKKVKSVKKKVVNNNSITKAKVVVEKDIDLIDESFNMIKALNSQVKKVAGVKDILKADLLKLQKRVDGQSLSHAKPQNKLIVAIKDEIMKDFAPLFKKLNFNSVKSSVIFEIGIIVEAETAKLKSELNSSNIRSKREFNKKLSDLELRLADALSKSKNLQREIKNVSNAKVSTELVVSEIESYVASAISKATKKYSTMFAVSNLDIDDIKKSVSKSKRDAKLLQKNLAKFKDEIRKNVAIDGVEISSVISKIKKLEDDNLSIKSLIEKYEDELFNRKKDESLIVEKKVKGLFNSVNSQIKVISSDKIALESFIENKVNEIISFVNDFEKRILSVEKMDLANSEKNILKTLNKDLVNYKKESSVLLKKYIVELDNSLKLVKKTSFKNDDLVKRMLNSFVELEDKFENRFNVEKKDLKFAQDQVSKILNKDLTIYKKESAVFMKSYFKDLDKRLNSITEISSKNDELVKKTLLSFVELENSVELKVVSEKEFIVSSHNDMIDKIKSFQEEQVAVFEKSNNSLSDSLKKKVDKFIDNSDIKFAKQLVSNNEFLTQISTSVKEFDRNLKEEIDTKFLNSKKQYEDQFFSHLFSFETELKAKEKSFLDKLSIIDLEKQSMLEELNKFKDEIGVLTKNYILKLDNEMQLLKHEEADFESKKITFFDKIKKDLSVGKSELNDYSLVVKGELYEVLNTQRDVFNANEDTFRTLFNEKISTLSEFTKNKLESIEKRFVEKNLKYVTDVFDDKFKIFSEYEDALNSKYDEIKLMGSQIQQGHEDFFVEIKAENDALNSRVEKRLVDSEKHFNKRFLDYDATISVFKNTLVDEVEDLIGEVNDVVNSRVADFDEKILNMGDIFDSKVKAFDQNIENMNLMTSSLRQNFKQLVDLKKNVESEVRGVRDELSDVKLSMDLIPQSHDVMNDQIGYMREYENQLLSLVRTLSTKGISKNKIKKALVDKGHPQFYVSVVLANMDELLN